MFLLGISTSSASTCATLPLSGLPFCNSSLSVPERVHDLLARMTLAEKINQTAMVGQAVPRLGMRRYNYGGEALHGVWSTCLVDNISSTTHNATGKIFCPTQLPAPVHMAASWNRALWREAADVASTEARSLYEANRLRFPDDDGFGTGCAKSLEGW